MVNYGTTGSSYLDITQRASKKIQQDLYDIRESQRPPIPDYVQRSPLHLSTGGGSTRSGSVVQQPPAPSQPQVLDTGSGSLDTGSGSQVQQSARDYAKANYFVGNTQTNWGSVAYSQMNPTQVVVYGYPELKDQKLNRSLSGFTKRSGGTIEINRKTEWVGERFPRERLTISARSSSSEYLRTRGEQAKQLNIEGWSASELLAGEKFIPAPKTLSYDTSGNTPAEVLFKGGKISLQNKYGVLGESAFGGLGARKPAKELSWSQKLVPYAALGVFGNKQFRQSFMTGVDTAVFSYFRGQGKLTQIGLNPSKLGYKDQYSGQYVFNRQKLFGDRDIQTFTAYTLSSPLMLVPAAKYAFAYLGLKGGVETLKEKGIAGAGEASVYIGLGASSIPRYNLLVRTASKLSSRYTPLEKTGIEYVEGTTIPRTPAELQSLEGKRIATIHVTTAKLSEKFLITAQTSGAKGFRIQNLLLGLYRSSPVSTKEVLVSGYTTRPKFITTLKDFPQLFQEASTKGVQGKNVLSYLRTASKPAAYLDYGGIGNKGGQSLGKFIIGNRPITLLKETLTLAKSPIGRNLRETSVMQIEKPATYLAPENIYKLSTEGQVYTPPAYYTKSGVLVSGKVLTGEEVTGSLVTTYPSQKRFTFYPERTANIFTNIAEKISGKPLSQEGFIYKTISSTRYFKLEILPAKTTPVTNNFQISPEELGKINTLDIMEYSKRQQSYSTGTRIISPSNILSSSSLFKSSSPVSESPFLFSSISGVPARSSGYFISKSISSYPISSTSYSFESSFVSPPDIISKSSRGSDAGSFVFPPSPPIRPTTAPPSVPPYRPSNVFQVYPPSREFVLGFGWDNKQQKVKKKKEKKLKIRAERTGVYVLPDLQAVFQTEAYNYLKFGKGEAVAPRLTKGIYSSAVIAFKGYGVGFIPTEQMRTGRIKL